MTFKYFKHCKANSLQFFKTRLVHNRPGQIYIINIGKLQISSDLNKTVGRNETKFNFGASQFFE